MSTHTINVFLIAFLSFLISHPIVAQQQTVKGKVYHDVNANQKLDEGETGLNRVAISNGRDVVLTDKNGNYSIPVDEDGIVFLMKPSGFIPKLSENFIQTAHVFNKPNGSPELHFEGVKPNTIDEIVNFPLYENKNEDALKIGILGDIQTKTIDDVYYFSKVVSQKMMDNSYDFIVALGDITYDNLRLFKPIKEVLSKTESPLYFIYGNHDRNYDAKQLEHRDETYEQNFGPSYFAFDYGDHTFIALNNIYPLPHHQYKALIDDKQMEFVANYLKTLPKDRAIHLLMHIPLEQVKNLNEFSRLFKNHPNVDAYAGHTHIQFFETISEDKGWNLKEPIEELVAGAVCGSWWHGTKDSFGVPQSMMQDGTPKGFWELDLFPGKKDLIYKVSEPDNRQMHIWTPFDFDREIIDFNSDEIIANIYAGNIDTQVEIKIGDSDWAPMNYFKGIDPFYKRLFTLQKMGIGVNENTINIGRPRESRHLWNYSIPDSLPSGIHLIQVRAKGPFGLDANGRSMLFNKTNNKQYFISKK